MREENQETNQVLNPKHNEAESAEKIQQVAATVEGTAQGHVTVETTTQSSQLANVGSSEGDESTSTK